MGSNPGEPPRNFVQKALWNIIMVFHATDMSIFRCCALVLYIIRERSI